MFESISSVSKVTRRFFSTVSGKPEAQQRRLMAAALSLLVVALVFVLYHDRDFWFPDGQDAENEILQSGPATAFAAVSASGKTASRKKPVSVRPQLTAAAQSIASTPPIVATTTRTVLPPLEVEVVAGDTHKKLRPASNAIELDVQADSQEQASDPPQPSDDQQSDSAAAGSTDETAARVTDRAAERVEMSSDTSQMVSESVKPGYPMLARQMKVQGSVILLAMIGRDGLIQDLRILSGPPILSGAAREAVKQWHFKPHYDGSEAVETVARITVNFTISTN
ncbi:MAG TPA: TonB family protein [Candidatus Sulfotelmatobacter sp.]|jgi:TonB family protein|nr:TonB family protein [Candidatus Sulfotelmatobacter sp.]